MRLTRLLAATFLITGVCSVVFAADAVTPPDIPNAETSDILVEPGPATTITPMQRLAWFDEHTFGISNLGGAIPGAAWSTMFNQPKEAGPNWSGFAERYGVALSTNAVSNTMEASLGAIWGEDPRYIRAGAAAPVKSRIAHILKMTVLAPNRNGELRPAYARFIASTAASYATNAWREPSDTGTAQSLDRVGFAILGRLEGNAFNEFWPDAKRKFFHRTRQTYP